jgi:hypothetical protein
MRLPQDLSQLLAVTVRDVIWYKDSIRSFLRDCGVPEPVIVDVQRKKDEPTVRTVLFVLDQLASRTEEGSKAIRAMLTKMYYWNDLHSVPADRKDAAVESLKALRQSYCRYEAQVEFQRQQERNMQEARVERSTISGLDHGRLESFRDEFDIVFSLADRKTRGDRFQDLMNRIFDYYCTKSRGPFERFGEQIDGLYYFDNHWYFVEVRWRQDKANAADVSVLRDRARDAFGGDTKALFISFNGFSEDCLQGLAGKGDERVILVDGYDLRCVLDCQIAFDVLLAEKQAEVVQNRRPFVGAAEIISRRLIGVQ